MGRVVAAGRGSSASRWRWLVRRSQLEYSGCGWGLASMVCGRSFSESNADCWIARMVDARVAWDLRHW